MKDDCDRPDIEYKDEKRSIKIDLGLSEWIVIGLVVLGTAIGGCFTWL